MVHIYHLKVTIFIRANLFIEELSKQTNMIRKIAAENQIGLANSYKAFEFLYSDKEQLEKYMSQVNHPNEREHELISDELIK